MSQRSQEPPRCVRDVMTRPVISVHPDASLVEAAQLMRAQDIGEVMVAHDGELLGVLTDRDITLRAVAEGVDPLAVTCHTVCTADPVTIGPDEEVATAAALMRRHAVRRLPVVEAGRPLGVIRLSDVPEPTPGRGPEPP
ncbi:MULTISPECIES: CBS domain-containing protein [Streptomyces]|uniref:CBS domain-containing protein n=3 Tax=Streptomyces TaxID=1883 RepID=A0ABT9L0X1_9ACTN|nr:MULTISPECIES: CBS domain-containing protein [Streptomyces]MBW8087889.1 CBS domain-containing protein [Streptomyces hygroscopicus subsp. hygroscopicus]MDP9614357.1 CBS domain-containing protein [Streptomyces demainii]GHJ32239.1 oxidoreductase [Streptomyces hygroscopicus]